MKGCSQVHGESVLSEVRGDSLSFLYVLLWHFLNRCAVLFPSLGFFFFYFFFCPAVPHFSCFFFALIPSPHLWTLMRPDYLSHYCRARASSCIVVLMNAWTLCSPTSDCSSLKNWFPLIRNGKWTKKKINQTSVNVAEQMADLFQ